MNTVKPESIALFCLTPGGVALARELQKALPMTCFTREALLTEGFLPFNGGFGESLRQAFRDYRALVVIGATGIVVRTLAPVIEDKLSDPAVVVIDERGQHVISLLSGHVGGANALARYLAGVIGADPVITTATDVNDLAALDSLAQQLDAGMPDFRTAVKTVNQMLVSQKRVGLWWDDASLYAASDCDTRGLIPVRSLDTLSDLDALVCVSMQAELPPLPVPVFRLVPRRVIAGIGCRRDTPFSLINTLLHRQLAASGLDPLALRGIGSISLKQNEPGLLELAASLRVPFQVFSAEELRPYEHHFPGSDFVRQTTGVGSVSGPAAWLMSQGQLIGETLREQGVTITLGVSH
ncbi:cobalt-precorrin 5A acetaldehyde-lyase [Enterobacter sp. BIGb0383]|uniref:cobalt-precorrin 5A hydrolase n=1 Tax=unclassified Enterobacter TaxID=2608935 RepID=UPI000F468B52|nr:MULTISPECIES: cobalt-precorrin 5A hydrolase [unclassified Enterobacter]ROP62649.1 cobalt-precorrin 5A acetaldehyde-lyase [Enterobacter sp. BIGb0383]ROS12810.1 cobalt-precorrin 5A acetaldehyde-lyase [Enterobacter sp. BIGb0359]